jgi:ribosomal protein S18 acetylase RimI-like enzyme
LHHIFTAPDFHPVEANLRECFRILGSWRGRGDVLELPGVTVASAGVTFQMFNAAFLSSPAETVSDLEERIDLAGRHFSLRGLRWSFWLCEGWVAKGLRRKAGSIFQRFELHLSSEMPGMLAESLHETQPFERQLQLQPAVSGETLREFRQIGALCFHVPPGWFGEVFDDEMSRRTDFSAWVAYENGIPVGTAAAVLAGGVTGLYNIAILPEYRRRGYGTAVTRLAAQAAFRQGSEDKLGANKLILQASAQGVRMYERMGFRTVTRIAVYNSA